MSLPPSQHPNVYNTRLPDPEGHHADSVRYLAEVQAGLARAVLQQDTGQCVLWVINLHKYIILYGLKFSRAEHVYLIKVVYGLLTTKNVDPHILDKYAKVLSALLKKKYLIPRSELTLDWKPLFTLFQFWEDSSPAVRGLLKAPQGFKAQIKAVIKVSRGYFTDSSTREMLDKWSHMLCPADRSMATSIRYFSLFLPTTKDIPPACSWQQWLPLFSDYWHTWGNSPVWEVDLLRLYSRLAFHRVGQVPWDPLMPDLYTRFMASFNLPVTYGGSGVHIKHGISGTACLGSMTKWIVSTLGGGSQSQAFLASLLGALQSYYHPANSNNSSELLHVFISCLCTYFVDRVHLERYNRKWETKVPPDKRLTDADIETFVLSVKPIAFLVLYNNYEDEARSVFQSLSLLAPSTIIPPLLDRLDTAADTLTEPHRFHVCVQAMSATAGPLIRLYPARALDLLHSLLPGIDVNDIWKCTDIFVLMSDLLEMIPLTDVSRQGTRGQSEERCLLAGKTATFESFVVEFMNRCFTLIENSVRVNIRNDGGNTDEFLNDEEIAADAAINDTFLRMCVNSSPAIFAVIFSKLTSYLSGRIVEPTVAGGILASMCKSLVQTDPAKGLAFFVPYLVRAVTERVAERGDKEEDVQDEELQFTMQLLGEVLSVKNVSVYRSTGAHLLPYLEPICSALDCTLQLGQKDEYELAHGVLSGALSWLCHVRILETGPRIRPELGCWGAMVGVEDLCLTWYRPGQQEVAVVTSLLERFLTPVMTQLAKFGRGERQVEKEELQRNLKLVYRIVVGVSELAAPEQEAAWQSCLSSNLAWLEEVGLSLPGGGGVRAAISALMCQVQDKMDSDQSDDTDSYSAILSVFDALLFCYGADEDEIGDHLEDHKREKLHREDKLVRGKRHLAGVHLERITLQWETQVWLKNLLVLESLSRSTLQHIFSLCIHQYSEVRLVAQELFLKLVGRVGKACHTLVIPLLVQCLKEGRQDDELKGALYMINSEKHMFFYSWEAAASIWPALVTAMHSDKQSVDDLLRDIGIKANRYYQDYVMYTLPLSAPVPPSGLLALVREQGLAREEHGLTSTAAMAGQLHYQALEGSLVSLVEGKSLHWRHEEMAVGMLLSMVTYDTSPSLRTTGLWLGLLLSDQRTVRLMAYQALEGILKLAKIKSRKVPLSELVALGAGGVEEAGGRKPGLRGDNSFLQYQDSMGPGEVQAYWSRPFLVKSYLGYQGWPSEGRLRVSHTSEDFQHGTDSVLGIIAEFFMDEAKTARFVELNSLEHEKGQDFFSTDRGLFLSFLLENLGPRLAAVFQPHIERLVGSPEESQQRAAAEMIYGVVRGSRFWDYESTEATWSWLLPVFQQVLNNVTSETQSDWDFCFSGVSNKADPNRLRPLYELLVTPENLVSQGAFKESSYLLFVSKCLAMNWRVRSLYCRTYNILREHWAHPFTNVRHQIASTLATLTIMDIPWAGSQGGSLGQGFPTKKLFIQEVIPRLSLNSHNPEFSSSKNGSSLPESREESPNTSSGSSEDVSMEADTGKEEDSETKRANRTLEMVSLWICHQIRLSSASLDPELFKLLPYLCQFIGTETDQDVSQACLQALCYLSACILPAAGIQPMLDMVGRIAHSESYKTKMSVLEFLQIAVFSNFPALVHGKGYRPQVVTLVKSLLQDPHITVRQKAAKILGGLLHSGFIQGEQVETLLGDLRSRIRPRMTRTGKRFRKDSIQNTSKPSDPSCTENLSNLCHHSGILGLCAFVEAFPYDVPSFLPPILMELSTHLNDPQPTPLTIKKSLQEFKRTHQDNWQEHKTKFTEDQLVVMTDLLVSQNYYA